MRRWSIVLLVILFLALPGAAQGQSDVGFDQLNVLLWPEYDRPDMLVIYKITLSSATKLPAQIDLRIPLAAGSPYNVAIEEVDGQLYSLNYTTSQDGDWLIVSFTAPTSKLQIEYYDPELTKTDSRRDYEFHWPGDVAIDNLTVEMQQPLTAENFQVAPNMGSWATGTDGLRYYTEDVGSVPEGTPVTLKLSYTKSDDLLSVPDQAPLQSSQPIGPSTSLLRMEGMLPYILGGLGVALFIGGGAWFWVISRKRATEPARQRHNASKWLPDEVQEVYCHQCGKRASKEDIFCRACGTRLRRE
ncbi:protein containg zinc-ribbon domain [Longilinea arvoryzae]|uniref:Protein containg zinc-ribbon domain n=1 Tax=Longilinea arvoryzae TaxID=360412 RepID=A0A0S7BJ63_9CHLR|nr:zinc ribbon domain-containing protein [Longilinea arvoryzae]GAP13905.1 protein containg zinc-ribbon domain [Longilinea arvoryzae]